MTNTLHEANRKRWDAGSEQWARGAESRGTWRRCPSEPELVLSPMELKHLADVEGKRAAVLGSGDNQVVFALAGLDAKVTSVDFSKNQLKVAEERAQQLGLSVSFPDDCTKGNRTKPWPGDAVTTHAPQQRG